MGKCIQFGGFKLTDAEVLSLPRPKIDLLLKLGTTFGCDFFLDISNYSKSHIVSYCSDAI